MEHSQSRIRRAHHKSRNGCRECKTRHIKCDEQRPTCANCLGARSRCSFMSFVSSVPIRVPTPSSIWSAPSTQLLPTLAPAALTPSTTSSATPPASLPGSPASSLVLPCSNGKDQDADELHQIHQTHESCQGQNQSQQSQQSQDCEQSQSQDAAPEPDGGRPLNEAQYNELLHHLETNPHVNMGLKYHTMHALLRLARDCEERAPYIMLQLLSMAAAHLSTVRLEHRAHYSEMLLHLQNRALMHFNAQSLATKDTYLAMFFFSGLLSVTTLFDVLSTLSTRYNLPQFLDRFDMFIVLSRGIQSVIETGSWSDIDNRMTTEFHIDRNVVFKVANLRNASCFSTALDESCDCGRLLRYLGYQFVDKTSHSEPSDTIGLDGSNSNSNGDETGFGDISTIRIGDYINKDRATKQKLLESLFILPTTSTSTTHRRGGDGGSATLMPHARRALLHATEITQCLLYAQCLYPRDTHQTMDVVMAWPIIVTKDYIDLLRQRQPEALLVLAHYAIMLHQARHHWLVGNAAQYLVTAIARHLGPYWVPFMEAPLTAIINSDKDN